MKILIHSNAPWAPTGYGSQVRLVAPRLAEHHDVAISAFYGIEGARLNWEGIPVFPGVGGDYGNAVLAEHARRFFGGARDGLVLSLMDVWVLDPAVVGQLDLAAWVPVDHDPVPPRVAAFFRDSDAVPIAMSRFGQRELAEFDPLYVPHLVGPEYRARDRAEARATVGVPDDAFLVGIVAANKGRPSRKCFQEALRAFAEFRARHDDAKLYLHTSISPNVAAGEDIGALLLSLELPEDSVLIADQYRQMFNPHQPDAMASIYSTFDVLLNPSAGEGFGIPIAEAQACGVPAIVTDFTAMSEVCGAGWKVGADPSWTGQLSWQARPKVDEIVAALEDCRNLSASARTRLAEQARVHALQYAADRVVEDHLLPALEAVEARLAARRPMEIEAVAA